MAKYKVFCETEGARQYWETTDDPVEECPNDSGHTVRAGSLGFHRSSKKRSPLASIGFGVGEINIPTAGPWTLIDRRTFRAGAEVDQLSKAFWSVECSIKTDGAAARIRMQETKLPENTDTVLENVLLPDTGGVWDTFHFNTSTGLAKGRRDFLMEAKRGSTPNFDIRGIVANLLERTR